MLRLHPTLCLLLAALGAPIPSESPAVKAPTYSVVDLALQGPPFSAIDNPVRDVELWAAFRHESGSPTHRIHGFWDGGASFRIRFTPTRAGRWTIVDVHSNRRELRGQLQGNEVVAEPAALHGFWMPDEQSPGRRWYRRSDGSHQYIVGNTLYSFLSETYLDGRPNGGDIATDVRRTAEYFRKVRFSAIGDLYPHPTDAPFLDDAGRPTRDGNYSHRPNPEWFRHRTDVAVRTAVEQDLIADLIVAGVDTPEARSALQPARNGGDAEPFLRYVAARYASFPNVWLTLINEYDIREPRYTPAQIVAFGRTLRQYLPYETPISVHRNAGPWLPVLNAPAWNDHVVIQQKLRDLSDSADAVTAAHAAGGADKPVINDELSYEGTGDRHTREDTVESHLGAFVGGGYGTTGFKTGNKLGQYFAGRFDASDHTSADNLRWLRRMIDAHVRFWLLEPVPIERSIFTGVNAESRAMQSPGAEYLLATDASHQGIAARLPDGRWDVRQFDMLSRHEAMLGRGVRGIFTFDAPDSRATLFHFRRIDN